jgi:hypothetical protein
MAIAVDIAPEAQTDLTRQAAAHGAALVAEGARFRFTSQNLSEFWNASSRPLDRNGFGLSIAETYCRRFFRMRLTSFLPCKTATTCTGAVSGR